MEAANGPGVAPSQEVPNKPLLEFFLAGWSDRQNSEAKAVQARCLELFERDHTCKLVPNESGGLCAHYPLDIIIPTGDRDKPAEAADAGTDEGEGVDRPAATTSPTGSPAESPVVDPDDLAAMFAAARFARTRSRFVVPVILHRGKNICRSSTLARQAEIKARQAQQRVKDMCYGSSSVSRLDRTSPAAGADPSSDDSVGHHRSHDIALLKALGVRFICDLMVEDRKVKYGFQVTSSEKVDKQGRYRSAFQLASVPYPGCELFTDLKRKKYRLTDVVYDWTGAEVNAPLLLPAASGSERLGVDWARYREWNLVELTQNYLKLFLGFLRCDAADNQHGLLVHCISGWDRTPLFISLLRISLWADGELHDSLSPAEMLYLTIGYDWLLFGHMLTDRLRKGEEILLFCFDFLQFVLGDEYAFEPGDTQPAAGTGPAPTAAASTTAGRDAEESHDEDEGAHGAAEARAAPSGTPPGFGTESLETHALSPTRPTGDGILLPDSRRPEDVPGDSPCRCTDSVESRPQSILSDDEVGGQTSGSSVGSPERGDGQLISPPTPHRHHDGAAAARDLAVAVAAAARSLEIGSSDSEDDSSAVELDGLVILDDVKAGTGLSEAAPKRAPSGLRLACGRAQNNSDRAATPPPGPSVVSPLPLVPNTTTNPVFTSGSMPMPGQIAIPSPMARGLQVAGSPRSVPIAIPNSIGKSLERFDDGGSGSWQMLGGSCRSFGGYPAPKVPQAHGRTRLSSSASSSACSDDSEDDHFQDAETSADFDDSPGSFVSRYCTAAVTR